MKRKSIILLVSLLSFILLTVPGCKKYEQIKIVSGKVESFTMNGLRSADIIISVDIENPAGKIILEEVNGTLKHSGKILGNVTLAPMTLAARSTATHKVTARMEIDKGVGLMYLMSFMNGGKLNECTVDIYAKGKAAGVKAKREYKDIPVKKLLEGYNHEKI